MVICIVICWFIVGCRLPQSRDGGYRTQASSVGFMELCEGTFGQDLNKDGLDPEVSGS